MPSITCRCGEIIRLHYGDQVALCPSCRRIYRNETMDPPALLEEQLWKCPVCGAVNDRFVKGLPVEICPVCGK